MMSVFEAYRIAISAMLRNKVRSFLSMLGIIIGVLSVVVMMAMSEGAAQAIQAGIAGSAESDLTVNAGPTFNRGWGSRDLLTWNDYIAVRRECRFVQSIVPSSGGWQSQLVRYRDESVRVNMLATVPGYFGTMRLTLERGRGLVDADGEFSRRVCVLGANVARKFNAGPRAIGDLVTIAGKTFQTYRVVGILEPRGRAGWVNLDDCIIVPIETGGQHLRGGMAITVMYVRLVPGANTMEAATDIARILRRSKRLGKHQKNNFNIVPTTDLSLLARQTQQILSALLTSIGLISLIVGGIGIMNIMLASVSERTVEIGIRKALGATRFAILAQFLSEALMLCTTGGGLGILAGYGLAHLIAAKAGWSLIVTPSSVTTALLVSAAVGTFFGVWPAWRGAHLDPVEALRRE